MNGKFVQILSTAMALFLTTASVPALTAGGGSKQSLSKQREEKR